MNIFEKKRQHFTGLLQTFRPLEEDNPDVIESQLDLEATVPREIDWLRPFVVQAVDAGHQVSEANMNAREDIILENGTVLAETVPATASLELEKRRAELPPSIRHIPTLDPAKDSRRTRKNKMACFKRGPIGKQGTEEGKQSHHAASCRRNNIRRRYKS